jgi:hypothetical protein
MGRNLGPERLTLGPGRGRELWRPRRSVVI